MKPKVKKTKTTANNRVTERVPEQESAQLNLKMPLHARRVWNKVRPKRAVTSTIRSFNDGGEKSYPQKPHLPPGVPKSAATTKGYLPASAKPKVSRGGSGDITVNGSYPPGGQTSYDAS